MTATMTRRRPTQSARRSGYLVAAVINAALLYLTFVRPTWRAVPFLTEETSQVLGVFALSLVAGIACNAQYLAYDPPWLRTLGDLVTTVVALTVMVRTWQVFPFDFGDSAIDWAMVFRVALAFGIAGCAIAVVVHTVSLMRQAARATT